MKRNQKNLTATGESITWNALNQPISMNGVTATYDALGRMVETGSGSSYQQFVFTPDGNPYAIYNASTSTLIKGTVPLPGGDTAIYNQSGLSYLRHTDWLGSSRLATTWAHAVYSKTAYAPFGETYNEAGTADRSFTGQDQDVVSGSGGTGAYDFLFRKQDPSAGRWLSPDPYGWGAVNPTNPQSLNRYSYALNNPLTLVDPNGLDPCDDYSTEGGYEGDCDSYGDPAEDYTGYGDSVNPILPPFPPSPDLPSFTLPPVYAVSPFMAQCVANLGCLEQYWILEAFAAENAQTPGAPYEIAAGTGQFATVRAVTHGCIVLNDAHNALERYGKGDLELAGVPFGLDKINAYTAKQLGVNVAESVLGPTALKFAAGVGEFFGTAGLIELGLSQVAGHLAKDECSYTPTNP